MSLFLMAILSGQRNLVCMWLLKLFCQSGVLVCKMPQTSTAAENPVGSSSEKSC